MFNVNQLCGVRLLVVAINISATNIVNMKLCESFTQKDRRDLGEASQ